ncbi:hypothetical protein SAZ11_39510 [Streptomyces sp. FXJ1.4098]|nr:hypothetical protein [Streptomyces sp. FXJ1.4098]
MATAWLAAQPVGCSLGTGTSRTVQPRPFQWYSSGTVFSPVAASAVTQTSSGPVPVMSQGCTWPPPGAAGRSTFCHPEPVQRSRRETWASPFGSQSKLVSQADFVPNVARSPMKLSDPSAGAAWSTLLHFLPSQC